MDKIQDTIQNFNKLGYEVIEIPNGYKNRCQEKLHLKDIDGYKYYMDYYHIEKGFIPEKFRKTNPYTIENIKLWLIKNNKNFSLISTEYVRSDKKLEWLCHKCNKIFLASWTNIISGNGCRHCKYSAHAKILASPQSQEESLLFRYPDIAKDWDYDLNADTPLDYKPKSSKKKWWKCPFCQNSYETSIYHRTKDGSGCPRCKISHGETQIYNYLKSSGIDFIQQHSFPDCYNKKLLRFDFYLPEYNLCIEFQGKQHYYPYDFASFSYDTKDAIRKYDYITNNDNIKREYCLKNDINLLEIPYTKINSINTILSQNIKSKIATA